MPTVSARKRRANRRNARKSTGPRTAEGKAIASQNALKYGLFTKQLILRAEDRKEFDMMRQGLIESFVPANVAETMIVDRIVIAQWKILRIQCAEAELHDVILKRMRDQMVQSIENERRLEQRERRYKNGGVDPLEQEQEQEQEQDKEKQHPEHRGMTDLEYAKDVLRRFDATEMTGIAAGELYRITDQPYTKPADPQKQMEHFARQEHRLDGIIFRGIRELQRMQKLRMEQEEMEAEAEEEDFEDEDSDQTSVENTKTQIEATEDQTMIKPQHEQELSRSPSAGTPGRSVDLATEGGGEGSLVIQNHDAGAAPARVNVEKPSKVHSISWRRY